MEREIAEVVVALLLSVAGFIGALTLLLRVGGVLIRRATEGERNALQGQIAELKTGRDDLLTRVADLETKEQRAQKRIGSLETEVEEKGRQVNTLCDQIEKLQIRLDDAEANAKTKGVENERLQKQNSELFESNKLLTLERNAYKSALALVGGHLAELEAKESTEAKAVDIEPAGVSSAPTTDEPKEVTP